MNIYDNNLQFEPMRKFTSEPKIVIIHHSGTTVLQSVETIHNFHKSIFYGGIGYHFYVRKDGKVYRGRPLEYVGAHCRDYSMNFNSIGVCFEGNFEVESMNAKQFQAGVELIRYLKDESLYMFMNFYPHKKYSNTDCPGKLFEFDRMIDEGTNHRNQNINNVKGDEEMTNWLKSTVITYGSNGYHVFILQSLLYHMGYNPNGIDGNVGDGCLNAIQQFQRDHGLAVDGSVGPATWNMIL